MRKLLTFVLVLAFSLTACGKPINDIQYEKSLQIEVDSYQTARTYLFGQLHYNNGVVTDVYCQQDWDQRHGVGQGRIPDPKFINCEHTWPQSKFKGHPQQEVIKSDLHHLFPSETNSNSTRGNHPFGNVTNAYNVCGDSFKGTIQGTNIAGFQPSKRHIGNVARAMFYISTRYNMPIDPIQERYLREWNKIDPVDTHERWRNAAIEKIQRTRNPFIDNPRMADQIQDF